MTRDEILLKLKEIIPETLGVKADEITPEARLARDLELTDSLDVVHVVMDIEEAFGIKIGDEEADKLKSVSDIIDLIEKRLKEQEFPPKAPSV